MKKLLAILLMLTIALCGAMVYAQAEDVTKLAGTYVLDASALGMPLQVYCVIDDTGAFQWTNKREGGADKGTGTIGGQDGVYVMLYSDSTNENLKTATFTLDGRSLVFSTRIPYGSSGFAPNTEDESNIIYPTAKLMAYEEYIGEYAGQFISQSDVMGLVVYDLSLTLSMGAEARFESVFAVMGEVMTYVLEGTFSAEDGVFTFTPDGQEPIVGTVDDGKGINLSLALSRMSAAPKDVRLDLATTAACAGVYSAVKDMSQMGFVVDATLALSKTGGYVYTAAIEGQEDYVTEGQFTAQDGALVFTPAAEGEPFDATLRAGVLTAAFPVSAAVPMTTQMTFYAGFIQGLFLAGGEDDMGNVYESTLTLRPDATYEIEVTANGAFAYAEAGTFAAEESSMGVTLVLTDETGVESAGVVSGAINITHNIDYSFNTLGFKYEKQ